MKKIVKAKKKKSKLPKFIFMLILLVAATAGAFHYIPEFKQFVIKESKKLNIPALKNLDLPQIDKLNLPPKIKKYVKEVPILKTYPLIEAVKKGNCKNLKKIIEAGAKINDQDEHGMTALMTAISLNKEDCVEKVLRYGPSFYLEDKVKRNAIFFARNTSSEKIQELILKNLRFSEKGIYYCAKKLNPMLSKPNLTNSKKYCACILNTIPKKYKRKYKKENIMSCNNTPMHIPIPHQFQDEM